MDLVGGHRRVATVDVGSLLFPRLQTRQEQPWDTLREVALVLRDGLLDVVVPTRDVEQQCLYPVMDQSRPRVDVIPAPRFAALHYKMEHCLVVVELVTFLLDEL